MFGFGGSSVSTPLLRVLTDVHPLYALGTPLPVAIPTAVAGLVGYHRRGLVRYRIAGFTILGGLPGVVVGALLTKYIPASWLMIITGAALLGIGLRSALTAGGVAMAEIPIKPTSADLIAFLIGLPAGLFAGVLANGGGPVLVPMYLMFLNLPMLEAVATSLATVVVLSIPGAALHWWLGHVDPQLVLFLTIGVIPASLLGSKLARKLGDVRLKRVFGWAMVLFGGYFLWREL
ncbi:MAG TPA: sulfite exporter TauE/SafE family protein [Symbiobacteriaceae bacterium]|jgi:hypothetical protein